MNERDAAQTIILVDAAQSILPASMSASNCFTLGRSMLAPVYPPSPYWVGTSVQPSWF